MKSWILFALVIGLVTSAMGLEDWMFGMMMANQMQQQQQTQRQLDYQYYNQYNPPAYNQPVGPDAGWYNGGGGGGGGAQGQGVVRDAAWYDNNT